MTHDNARRSSIRREIRKQRQSLDENFQRAAAEALARRISRLAIFRNARHIAAYLPVSGEMNLLPLIDTAWSMGKTVYLPRLIGQHLAFHRFEPGTTLLANALAIPEPDPREASRCPAARLDIVFAPLVAFDANGNRLGMGGGFYDRTFAFLQHRMRYRKPLFIGAAYEFQQHALLPHAAWDVPLDAVITENAFYRFQGRH